MSAPEVEALRLQSALCLCGGHSDHVRHRHLLPEPLLNRLRPRNRAAAATARTRIVTPNHAHGLRLPLALDRDRRRSP